MRREHSTYTRCLKWPHVRWLCLLIVLLLPLAAAQNGTVDPGNQTADPGNVTADPGNGTDQGPPGDASGDAGFPAWIVINLAAAAVLIGAFIYVARRRT